MPNSILGIQADITHIKVEFVDKVDLLNRCIRPKLTSTCTLNKNATKNNVFLLKYTLNINNVIFKPLYNLFQNVIKTL